MNWFEKHASQIKQKLMKTTLDLLNTCGLKQMRIAGMAKK